jgi:hypothetical protein
MMTGKYLQLRCMLYLQIVEADQGEDVAVWQHYAITPISHQG